jgi:HK97 family phage portal protein
LHFAGPGFDGLSSPSAIKTYARRSIGGAIATEEFSAKFFANGALQKHVIKSPSKMTVEAAQKLREQWTERYAGLENSFKPIVLTEGLDVKELSLSAEDRQLIEARRFQVVDIARAFGVPPILIQEGEKTSSWGSGVEQIIIAFVRFTLAPHLERFRDELNRKLFRRAGRVANFDTEALTQPDATEELAVQLVAKPFKMRREREPDECDDDLFDARSPR